VEESQTGNYEEDLRRSIKIYKGLELKCVRELIDDFEEKYRQ